MSLSVKSKLPPEGSATEGEGRLSPSLSTPRSDPMGPSRSSELCPPLPDPMLMEASELGLMMSLTGLRGWEVL